VFLSFFGAYEYWIAALSIAFSCHQLQVNKKDSFRFKSVSHASHTSQPSIKVAVQYELLNADNSNNE
jgi:hypothetical protein